MTSQPRLSGLLAVFLAIIMLASGLAVAQSFTRVGAQANSWTAPRTAWGDPDLQGKWTFASTGTPMERPAEFGDREFLTPEEVATKVEAAASAVAEPEDPEEARAPAQSRCSPAF